MCIPKPPKPDPAIKQAQEAAKRVEQERMRQLKEQQLESTKRSQSGSGMRSLISSLGGFGRNFYG